MVIFILKYFGLKKGIVGYNFVVNHVAVNSQIISPNEHESHYLFDIVFNNNSEIDPEVITGDMHVRRVTHQVIPSKARQGSELYDLELNALPNSERKEGTIAWH